MDLRQLPLIEIGHFFALSLPLKRASRKEFFTKPLGAAYKLQKPFLDEEHFCEIGAAWHEEGIFFFVKVDQPFQGVSFPDIAKGDAFECFIDTKGIDGALLFHKYCHQFVFLPKEEEGLRGVETSSFRGEEKHELADPTSFSIETKWLKSGYEMEIFIPEISLFGYSPEEGSKLSFAYRMHRKGGSSEHFPVSGIDYKLESYPKLWAKFLLVS